MVGVKPGSLCYSSSAAFVPDAPQKRGDDAAHPAHEARFPCAPRWRPHCGLLHDAHHV